jgi:hypothetical protein
MPLSPSVKEEQLTSYLTNNVTSTSVSTIESGLAISLLANSTYFIENVMLVTNGADGINWNLAYTGLQGTCLFITYDPATGVGTSYNLEDAVVTTHTNASWETRGIIRTSTSGILRLLFAKNTDVGADTIIQAGSCLVARRL